MKFNIKKLIPCSRSLFQRNYAYQGLFDGVVEENGRIRQVALNKDKWELTVEVEDVLKGAMVGDIIVLNGKCLKITEFQSNSFVVDFSADSSDALPLLETGAFVKMERCLSINKEVWERFVLFREWVQSFSQMTREWNVPWEGDTIIMVMILWLLSFWMVGSWVMPVVVQAIGCYSGSFSMREMALYHLATDVLELAAGLGVLQLCLARFKPLPKGWFPISFKGLWFLEAFYACTLFPLVHAIAKLNMKMLPVKAFPTQIEQSFSVRDPVALLVYVVVVSVCAPIWEEVIFRGFLLPSLTRYLPVWGAIVVSSIIFALAHFQPQRLLPLLFLGMIIGFVFVRSRNLLASMLLHSLWNGYVFVELFIKCCLYVLD